MGVLGPKSGFSGVSTRIPLRISGFFGFLGVETGVLGLKTRVLGGFRAKSRVLGQKVGFGVFFDPLKRVFDPFVLVFWQKS